MNRPEQATSTVSVVIPHFHDLVGLDHCLTALGKQTVPRQRFEIVVADNNSPEGREAVAAVVGERARLVIVETRGAGPARNGGVVAATGEILAFTDADCVPEPEWLAAGVAALDAWDIVGGQVCVTAVEPDRPSPEEAFEAVFAFDNKAYVERKGFTVTANLFVRRTTYQAIGDFRVGVPEDLEWCHRGREAGFRIGYADGAIVRHPARRNWVELRHKWRRLNAEAFKLMVAAPRGRVRWIARSLALPASAAWDSPRVLQSGKIAGLAARAGALSTLWRIRLWRFVDALGLAFGRA